MLNSKGRIKLSGDAGVWIQRAIEGINEAVLTHEIVSVAGNLLVQRDPSDCMIAATAIVNDMTLLTADDKLLQLPGLKTLANR